MADGGVIFTVILMQYILEMGHVSVWMDFFLFYDTVFVLLPFWGGGETAVTIAVTACAKTLKITIIGNV